MVTYKISGLSTSIYQRRKSYVSSTKRQNKLQTKIIRLKSVANIKVRTRSNIRYRSLASGIAARGEKTRHIAKAHHYSGVRHR